MSTNREDVVDKAMKIEYVLKVHYVCYN